MADKQRLKRPRAHATVSGWSKKEKFYLLQGLKQFRSRDISNIAEMIPTKTPEQIKNAIEYYREIATTVMVLPEPPVRKSRNHHPVPLCSWAKYLQETFPFKKLETVTADSIRMIAELECEKPSKHTKHSDFRKIYHAIADAMEGKPLPEDPFTFCVLDKCMLELALYSKTFNEDFLDELKLSGSPEQVLEPTDSEELTCIKLLASRKSNNPLNISVEHLKPQQGPSSEFSDDGHDLDGD